MPLDFKVFTELATVPNALYLAGSLIVLKYHDYLWWPIQSWRSPLRNLCGPPNDSVFLGHLLKINQEDIKNMHMEWFAKYGKTFRFRGVLGVRHLLRWILIFWLSVSGPYQSYLLYTADMKAVNL